MVRIPAAFLKKRHFVFAVLLIGIVLRYAGYASDRSLWLDEAVVANRLFAYTVPELVGGNAAHTLAYPVGFLYAEKLAVRLGGHGEEALRFVPFVAGVAALVAFAVLTDAVFPAPFSLLALFLLAINPMAVYYSGEVKPYALDLLAGVLAGLLFLGILRGRLTGRRLLAGAIAALCAVWFSYGAVFMLVGGGAGLALLCLFRGERRTARALMAPTAAALAGTFLYYLLVLKTLVHQPGLVRAWSVAFPPWGHPARLVPWAGMIWALFSRMELNYPAVLGGVLLVLGGILLWRRDRPTAVMVFAPVVAVLLACAVYLYPFMGRLVLFLVPGLLLAVAAVVAGVPDRAGPWRNIFRIILTAVVIWFPLRVAWRQFREPFGPEAIKPALACLVRERTHDAKIYVYKKTLPAFRYYAPRFGFSPRDYIAGRAGGLDERAYRDDVRRLRPLGRVWVVVTHIGVEQSRLLFGALDRQGDVTGRCFVRSARGVPPGYTVTNFSAAAFLYRFHGPEPAAAASP